MEQNIFARDVQSFRPVVLALITSLVLIVADWQHSDWFDSLRSVTRGTLDPIYVFASYPVLSGDWLSEQAQSEDVLRRENAAFKAERLQNNVRLQKLAELSAENTRLRGLLNTPLIIDGRMMISEIIGTDPDPLRHILVINRGDVDGLFVGQMVLDDKGVVGQVLDVFSHSARILLISDKENAISVRIERTGMRGITAGTGDSGRLSLQYVPKTADVKVGDRVFTSGLGERFPAGYPVGVVFAVQREGNTEFADIAIKPSSQLEGGHHVILLFSAPLAKEQPHNESHLKNDESGSPSQSSLSPQLGMGYAAQ
ncbi:MAG: rod shape-determining protein MreC [Candidatus Saccharibacteria bacterium]|nr:rod shape-determining protein MreC [Moraxellaceae bacterium]